MSAYPYVGGLGSSWPYYANFGLYGSLFSYGTLNLTVSSPPQSFTEPVSVSEIRTHLNLPERSPADQAEQDEISSMIAAARAEAELAQGRELIRRQWDFSIDYWPAYQIELGLPLISVELVQYKDSAGGTTTLTENTDYVVDTSKQPGLLTPPYSKTWPSFTPWPTSAVLIRFTTGFSLTDPWWADSGQIVKQGIRQLVCGWFTNRIPVGDRPEEVMRVLRHGARVRAR